MLVGVGRREAALLAGPGGVGRLGRRSGRKVGERRRLGGNGQQRH